MLNPILNIYFIIIKIYILKFSDYRENYNVLEDKIYLDHLCQEVQAFHCTLQIAVSLHELYIYPIWTWGSLTTFDSVSLLFQLYAFISKFKLPMFFFIGFIISESSIPATSISILTLKKQDVEVLEFIFFQDQVSHGGLLFVDLKVNWHHLL